MNIIEGKGVCLYTAGDVRVTTLYDNICILGISLGDISVYHSPGDSNLGVGNSAGSAPRIDPVFDNTTVDDDMGIVNTAACFGATVYSTLYRAIVDHYFDAVNVAATMYGPAHDITLHSAALYIYVEGLCPPAIIRAGNCGSFIAVG
ncbi:MAG: hypothetical protein IJ993_00640, partial [Akkermansia sp.]|nr:hypothetical protein [Akkermansia sp.]